MAGRHRGPHLLTGALPSRNLFPGPPLSSLLSTAPHSCATLTMAELKGCTGDPRGQALAWEPKPPPWPLRGFWGLGMISPSLGWVCCLGGTVPLQQPWTPAVSPVPCAAPEQPDRVPDSGPPQRQCLEAAVPQALGTVQAGGGGGLPTSDSYREALICASQPVPGLEAEGEHLSLSFGFVPLQLSGNMAGVASRKLLTVGGK